MRVYVQVFSSTITVVTTLNATLGCFAMKAGDVSVRRRQVKDAQ